MQIVVCVEEFENNINLGIEATSDKNRLFYIVQCKRILNEYLQKLRIISPNLAMHELDITSEEEAAIDES